MRNLITVYNKNSYNCIFVNSTVKRLLGYTPEEFIDEGRNLFYSLIHPDDVKMVKEKKVEDLSLGMFLTLLIGIILWVVYGVLRDDWPIIITNSFSVLLNFFILFLKFKYRKNT